MLQRFGDTLPERDVKFAPVDLKSVEADGTFAGYASLFGTVDLGQDLVARGRLMPEVTRAREVLSLMRADALDGLSIGFRTQQGRTDPASGVRRLDKIDLWEISVVTFPMLPEARVSTVKRRTAPLGGSADQAKLASRFRRGAQPMRPR
ncbi:MAG TPA: HK97 family phage prohead protease [Methyloceanibacter sp.]|nr:HK97 family phage prohead protease [Methyloceanibacter sp.]